MNCDVTLTAEEFKNLHNALWRLGNIQDPMVEEQVSIIRSALEGAYAQEGEAFDRKMNHFSEMAAEHGLTSTWSIYEIDDLNAKHPYVGADMLIYTDHSGKVKYIGRSIEGDTWLDLYRAADLAIADSGDDHHIFIEAFTQEGSTLRLSTGS